MEMEIVDLSDVLEGETKVRSENNEPSEPKENIPSEEKDTSEVVQNQEDVFSNLEFDEAPEPEVEHVEAVPQITDKVAKESAEMVIDLIEMFNDLSLPPLARWKIHKKMGGKEVVKKLQLIYEKSLSEDKLTAKEKRQVCEYKAYLKDKEEVEASIPFSSDDRRKLETAMTSYFKKKNIQFTGDYAFWLELAMIEGMKIANILMI